MSDNLNEKMPDSETRKKEQELNRILKSVDGGKKRDKSGLKWEDELTSAIAKRSRSDENAPESYEKILDELDEKNAEKEEKPAEEASPENPQEDVQELIEQLAVAQRVTEMTQNKKNMTVAEEEKAPEAVSDEKLPQTEEVSEEKTEAEAEEEPVNEAKTEDTAEEIKEEEKAEESAEEPEKTEETPVTIADNAREELEKTIIYNVPKKASRADVMAVKQAVMSPPAQERKPVKKIVKVEKPEEPEKTVAEVLKESAEPPVKSVPEQAKPEKPKKKKKTFKEKVMGLLPNKEDSAVEKIRKVVFMCSICAILVCGYMVGDYYIDLWKSDNLHNDIAELYDTYPLPDNESNASNYEANYDRVYTLLSGAKKLLDRNPDVAGYITIPNTPISNPIMQSADNKKYLHMNIDGGDSRAGELFLDYRNHFDDVKNGKLSIANSDNLIIYGHNMANESMFGSLKYYQRDDSYYSKHPIIYLNSNYECYTYKIFAYFLLDAVDSSETAFDCWNKLNFKDEEDFYDFVNEAKKRSITLNDVDVKYGDKLVTLSTCNTVLGDTGRLIVMGRLLRDNEKPFDGTNECRRNSNVKWPSIYYNSRPNEKYDPDAEFIPYGSGGEE